MQNSNACSNRQQTAAVQLRLGPLFELVENWRRSQPKIPPRSEAIRELVRLALEARGTAHCLSLTETNICSGATSERQ